MYYGHCEGNKILSARLSALPAENNWKFTLQYWPLYDYFTSPLDIFKKDNQIIQTQNIAIRL